MMLNKSEILNILRKETETFSSFGVFRIGLFGSYKQNLQSENSDIDILLEFESGKETFDNLMSVYDFIQTLFPGKKIEIVTSNGLSKHFGPGILKEAEYVKIAS